MKLVTLARRAIIAVDGDDAHSFLQGIISQDMGRISEGAAAHGALLTPQGKYLHDFLLIARDGAVLLDCEAARAPDLIARLRRYRLRAAVTFALREDLRVLAAFGNNATPALGLSGEPGSARDIPIAGAPPALAFVDPRLPDLGCRIITTAPGATENALCAMGFARIGEETYDEHRIRNGVADGSRDMAVERATLIEANFDLLNGIAWDKGCFLGQELTARMHYRGLAKRRLLPVRIDGPRPAPGTPVTCGARTIGEVRSAAGDHALALMRLDACESRDEITAGAARLSILRPAWATF